MSTGLEVWVAVDGDDLRAGSLYEARGRSRRTCTFSYAAAYLADPRGYELDPALPLTTGAIAPPDGREMFRAFDDTAPDRWGRGLIERAELTRAREVQETPRSMSELDFVLGVRDDLRQGAVRFRGEDGFLADDGHGVPALTDLPALLRTADEVDRAPRREVWAGRPQALLDLLRAGSSLGGARPKAHVANPDGTLSIAKFPRPKDDWNVMAWEFVALELAERSGIDVPAHRLHRIGDRAVLLVDRFDRTAGGARIGYWSAMTALEANDHDAHDYLEIAQMVEERSLTASADLAQLWRRIVFGRLIGNTDDHLRNHGFLRARGNGWRLSPAFDVNPNPDPDPFTTSVGGAIDRDLAPVESAARAFRLTSARASEIRREVEEGVQAWRDVARTARIDASEIAMMEPAFG